MSVPFGTCVWSRRAVSKVCAVCERGIFRRAGRMLAVEFPSPCDGTSLNWQFVFGGLDKENRAPSKECNLCPESLSKDEPPRGPYHRSVRAPHSMNPPGSERASDLERPFPQEAA